MKEIGEIKFLNPYKNIWMKTSKTIDSLLIHGFDKRLVNLNFLISGLVTVLSNYHHNYYGLFGIFGSLAIILIFSVLGGFLLKYLLSYTYLLIGKIWKGKASYNEMVLVISLALIPEIIELIYILINVPIIGKGFEINYVISLITWIFSMRILVIGLSKIQGFTYGIAVLNLVFPAIVFLIFQTLWRLI